MATQQPQPDSLCRDYVRVVPDRAVPREVGVLRFSSGEYLIHPDLTKSLEGLDGDAVRAALNQVILQRNVTCQRTAATPISTASRSVPLT